MLKDIFGIIKENSVPPPFFVVVDPFINKGVIMVYFLVKFNKKEAAASFLFRHLFPLEVKKNTFINNGSEYATATL